MELPNISPTTLAALWIASTLVILPLSLLWLRYGVRPVLDAAARVRSARGNAEERFAALEARTRSLSARVETLARQADASREPWRS
jgi:hypothetical protein